MSYSLELPRALGCSRCSAVLKSKPEDFYVEEVMNLPASGGEHIWLWIEKTGQNTDYVAKQLARKCSVRTMDIGFAGLKDRWAVTRQWLSVYLGGRPEADWWNLDIEGVKVLDVQKQERKLRRGQHQGNRFRIVLRELESEDELGADLQKLAEQGFPNYFGLQRFGRDGANLSRGAAYFEGRIKANRNQRAYYLSAARAYLFNLILANRVLQGSWNEPDATAPLYGDPQPSVEPATQADRAVFEQYPVLVAGLNKNRMKLDRRPCRIIPKDFHWSFGEGCLTLEFSLPPGAFATSLLDELFVLRDGSADMEK